jgi:hypothetical protein
MKKLIVLISLFAFIGIFRKVDGQIDTTFGNQSAYYRFSEPLNIDSTQISLQSGKIYFHFNTNQSPTKLEFKDFNWLEKYPVEYFTSYLVNTSDSIFTALKQDGSLIMIQEALDENGNWNPIEYWVPSYCGNSYDESLKLDSGKCVMIPIKKYSGDFATKIRMRFLYGPSILISDSFDGSIMKSQFKKQIEDVYGILYKGPAHYLTIE